MKKKSGITMLLLLLVMLFTLSITVTASAASYKTKAIKAYKTFLAKSKIRVNNGYGNESLSTSKLKFALVYLDNDTIPELIAYDLHGGTWYRHFIFAYKKGKVKQISQMNSNYFAVKYYKKKGVLCCQQCDGKNEYYYVRVKGTKRTDILYKRGSKYYKCVGYNRKSVTKSKFNSLLKKYVGSTKTTKIRYYKNTAANRKKYLK